MEYEKDWAEKEIQKWLGSKAELTHVLRLQAISRKAAKETNGTVLPHQIKCRAEKWDETAAKEEYNRLFQEVVNMPYKSKQNSKLYREKCKELKELHLDLNKKSNMV